MSIIKITGDNQNLRLLLKHKCVNEEDFEMYRCNCGAIIPSSIINKNETFFYCPRCEQSRKINIKNVINKKIYLPIQAKIKKLIKENLLKHDLDVEDKFKEIIVKVDGCKIPLNVFEFSNPSSLLPANNSIIVYYDPQEYEKIKNVYSDKRIYELQQFFQFDKKEIKEVFLNHKKNIGSSKILEIKERVTAFCNENTFDKFEVIVLDIFTKLKEKSIGVEEFLNYLKKYHNTLISKKPIPMGANHPSDVEFIDLFEYFNDLFKWNKNRGADAKMYIASNISEKTITNKIITNHAREMVIVTNQHEVEPSAWRYVWNAYKDNHCWKFFIIDLDLISLILYHFNIEDLFNENGIKANN